VKAVVDHSICRAIASSDSESAWCAVSSSASPVQLAVLNRLFRSIPRGGEKSSTDGRESVCSNGGVIFNANVCGVGRRRRSPWIQRRPAYRSFADVALVGSCGKNSRRQTSSKLPCQLATGLSASIARSFVVISTVIV